MKLASAEAVVARVFRDVFAEREHLLPSQWAERYRLISSRTGSRPGPWRNATNPALVAIMDAYADPRCSRVVLKAAAQAGKTECIINCMLWSAFYERLPMMYVTGNTELARSFMQDRLAPTVADMPALAGIRTGRKWDEKAQQIRFAACDLFCIGANSASGLASRPIARLFPDEIDKWADTLKSRGRTEGRALELARARTEAFRPTEKEMCSSTPTDEGVGIDLEYSRSDQRTLHAPCLACGQYQPLSTDAFDRVRWDVPAGLPPDDRAGKSLDDDALAVLVAHVKRTAWYECRHCGAKMGAGERPRMLAASLWVAKGQAIDGQWDAAAPGAAEVIGDGAETDVWGFHLHGLASPFRTWGDVAAGFVALRGMPDRAWVNNVLGEAWREPGERADHHDLHRLHTQRSEHAPSFDRGTVPALIGGKKSDRCPIVLTGAIDVQVDRVYIQVDGWGAEQTRTVIDFDILPCPEINELRDSLEDDEQDDRVLLSNAWAEVERAIFRRYPVEGSDRTLPVSFWAIDSGYRTREIYAFCRRINALAPKHGLKPDCILPAKGQPHHFGDARISLPERGPDGKPRRGSVQLLQFNPDASKDEANRRLHLRLPQPMATVMPRDVGPEFTRQLTSEERVMLGSRGRNQRMVWRMRPGRTENHWWDTFVLGLVLAEHRGLRSLRAPSGARAPRAKKTMKVSTA